MAQINAQAECDTIQAQIPAGRERAHALRQLAQRCMQAVSATTDLGVKYHLVTMARHIQRRADREMKKARGGTGAGLLTGKPLTRRGTSAASAPWPARPSRASV